MSRTGADSPLLCLVCDADGLVRYESPATAASRPAAPTPPADAGAAPDPDDGWSSGGTSGRATAAASVRASLVGTPLVKTYWFDHDDCDAREIAQAIRRCVRDAVPDRVRAWLRVDDEQLTRFELHFTPLAAPEGARPLVLVRAERPPAAPGRRAIGAPPETKPLRAADATAAAAAPADLLDAPLPTPMLRLDRAHGTILAANAALADLVGRPDRAACANLPLTELVDPRDRRAIAEFLAALRAGGATDRAAEVRLAAADGRDVVARLTLIPDPASPADDAEAGRVLLVARDVSSESRVAQLMARADQLAEVAARNGETLRTLERALDRAPVGFALHARGGELLRANPPYEAAARADDVARAIESSVARTLAERQPAAGDAAAAHVRSYPVGDDREDVVGTIVWPREPAAARVGDAAADDEVARALARATDDDGRVALAWATRDDDGTVRFRPVEDGPAIADVLDARSRATVESAVRAGEARHGLAATLADGRAAEVSVAPVPGEGARLVVAVSLDRPTPEQSDRMRDELATLREQSAQHAAAAQKLRAELDEIDRDAASRDARLAAERAAHLDAVRLASAAGTFAWDATDGRVEADARARELLACGDGPLNQGTLLAAVDLDDRQAYERALFDALNADGGDAIDLIARIGRDARPVRIVGRVLFDDAGAADRDPTRLVAGVVDLAEATGRRKRLDALGTERDALSAKVAALEADVARVTADLASRVQAATSAEARATAAERERSAIAADADALRATIAERDAAATAAKREHAKLVAEADALKKTIAQRDADAAALAKEAATFRATIAERDASLATATGEAGELRAAVEDRERRAAAAERDAAKHAEEAAALRKTLADRESRATDSERAIAKLDAEAAAARALLAERTAERDALASQASKVAAELKAAHQRATDAERAREATDAQLASKAAEAQAFDGRTRELAAERDALSSRVAALEPELKSATADRAAVEQKLAKAEKDRGKLDEKFKKSEAERLAAADALAKAEAKLRVADATRAEAEKRAAKLERERTTHEEAAKRAESARSAAAAALAKLEADRAATAAQLDETSLAHAARVAEQEAAFAKASARIADAERARDAAIARADAAAKEIADLRAAAKAAEEERNALATNLEAQQQRVATLDRERTEAVAQAKTLERDRAALEANIRTLHRDRATLEADAARQGRAAEAAVAELNQVKARHATADADRAALEARVAALESSLADALAGRASTQDQLDAAARDRDAARAALRLRTAELNAILELAPDAIRIRAEGVTRHNAAAAALFGDALALGFDDAAAARLRVLSVDDAPVNGRPPHLPAAAALAGESRAATLGLGRDGEEEPRFVHSAAAPIRIDGRVVGAVVVDADQTELRRLESQLARREQELNAVFQNTGVGVAYLDGVGRVIDANPQTSVLLGFAHGDLAGRPLAEIAASDADRATLDGQILAVLSGELASCSAEFQLTRRDDRAHWVQLTVARGAAASDADDRGAFALVVLIQDVDELHRLRDAAETAAGTLAAARSRARLLASTGTEAVALLDAGGAIVDANDAARRLLAVGDDAARYVLPETGEAITSAAFWPRLARGAVPTDFRVERGATGGGGAALAPRVARVSVVRAAGIDGVGDADGRLVVVRAMDVTELASLQEELRRAQGRIVEAHTQMRERTLQLEGNFVSAMQQLGAAAATASPPARTLASDARLSPDVRDAARRVADAIRVHERIVAHFNAAATAPGRPAGPTAATSVPASSPPVAGVIAKSPVDLHALIEEAVELVDERFRAGSRLRRQLNATRSTCDVDAALARHGLWSIFAHAVSQAPRTRGGAVVRTSVTPDGDRLAVTLTWPTSRRNTAEIFIARSLVEAAGGALEVGEGAGETETRTTMTFPLAGEHAQAIAAATPPAATHAAAAPAERAATAVLLVEDHDSTARVLARQLVRLGCEVRHVRTLPEARAAIDRAAAAAAASRGTRGAAGASADRIDLIVCDLTMPGGDAVAFLADVARRELPAIALRGYDAGESTDALRAAGVVEQLVKPVDLNALAASIKRLARGR